ncbi:MAG: hypothetical protein QM817_33965 [Archangium sp.]
MLTLCLAMTLSAAPSGEAYVVLMRRSGVPQAKAMEIAKDVSAQLNASGVPVSAPVDDLSKCNGKKPCLVDAARKKKFAAVVLVEVGTVLDDAFARAEAVSVEEDGKRIALAEADGKLTTLSETLKTRVAVSLVGPLQTLLGISAPPVVVAQPEPPPTPAVEKPVEKPVVAEKPVEVVKKPLPEISDTPAEKPFMTTQRTVGLVVAGGGAATLIVSAILGGSAASAAGQYTSLCPAGTQCNNPEAFKAWQSAAGTQNTALVVMAVGAGLLVTGGIVFLTGGGGSAPADAPSADVSFVPLQGGGAAVVSGKF